MTEIQNQEFREQQELSKYPFVDTATLLASTGITLPPDTFLDASLYPIGAVGRPRLSQIIIENRIVTLYLGDTLQNNLASISFDPLFPPTELYFTDAFERPAGVLVSDIERLAVMQAWPQGTHVFPLGAAEFVASCTIPIPEQGVSGIKVGDTVFADDVWFIGEDGVAVREVDGAIRIDIVGDPLFLRRNCEDLDLFEDPPFVRRINGIGTTEYGIINFYVHDELATTVLRIYPENENTLKIELVGQGVQ